MYNLAHINYAKTIQSNHSVEYGKQKGDFVVDGKYTIEVGGASKTNKQIAGVPNAYILADDMEFPYGCSFYQWVNRLRIKEAKRLKMEHPELTARDIAEHGCGFSSRQAFYRTFLRETGQSPSEWWAAQNNPK